MRNLAAVKLADSQSMSPNNTDGLVPALSSSATGASEANLSDCAKQRPLLKASPPMPVNAYVGRYRIRIWRATSRQPFGINFVVDGNTIIIGEDLDHLGLRGGDMLVTVNGRKAAHVDECRRILGDALMVDLMLQHRELDDGPVTAEAAVACTWDLLSIFRQLETTKTNQNGSDAGKCIASPSTGTGPAPPLRALLSTTCPTIVPAGLNVDKEDGGVEFEITLTRISLKQRFGLSFALEAPQMPSMNNPRPQRIAITEDAYQLGVDQGDVVLAANGVPYQRAADCQRILERSMTVTLRMKRISADDYPQIMLPADVEMGAELSQVEEVSLPSSRPCDIAYCR